MLNRNQTVNAGDNAKILQAAGDIHYHSSSSVIDDAIYSELKALKQLRFYPEFNYLIRAKQLAIKILNGDLISCSDTVKVKALSWCARLLSSKDEEIDLAENCISTAKDRGTSEDSIIAEAFLEYFKTKKHRPALKKISYLNTPSSRSAALRLVFLNEGYVNARKWIADVSLSFADLDADGKTIWLIYAFEQKDLEAVSTVVDHVNEEDFANSPALYGLLGRYYLIQCIPEPLRFELIQPPFALASFPISTDSESIRKLELAIKNYNYAFRVETDLNLPKSAKHNFEMALWLELRTPTHEESARKRLNEELLKDDKTLRLVHFALQFGIELNLDSIQKTITQKIALEGGMSFDVALARFSIALKELSPRELANYIEAEFDDLNNYLTEATLIVTWVNALVTSKDILEAKKIYSEHKDKLTDHDASSLETIFNVEAGANPIDLAKQRLEDSNTLQNLTHLVLLLEEAGRWKELEGLSYQLFIQTKSVVDAHRYVAALYNNDKIFELLKFFNANSEYLDQSDGIKTIYAWALYLSGDINGCSKFLARINSDSRAFLRLHINLATIRCEWELLLKIATEEFQSRDALSARELMSAAQIAHLSGSKDLTKKLLEAAVEKDSENPQLLISAYSLATVSGFENEDNACEWLNKASELSNSDGPIKQVTLDSLALQQPEWEKRTSETWQHLSKAELPMCIAAKLLNRTTSDLFLFQALGNLKQHSVWKKNIISTFAGNREFATEFKLDSKIGIDATSLITLSFLDMLDVFDQAVNEIHVCHSLPFWLFQEQSKILFHQPSQIAEAKKVIHLLNIGTLKQFEPGGEENPVLSKLIGEDLSVLITEAMSLSKSGRSCYLVRSGPVYRVSSFMKEVADLEEYYPYLSSCSSIVRKMKERGVLTSSETVKALNYLNLHEKEWPQEPEIKDESILILDNLSIVYFNHLGVLDRIHEAGFEVRVNTSDLKDFNNLITYESSTNDATRVLGKIKDFLYAGISSGKIRFSSSKVDQHEDLNEIFNDDPLVGLFSLTKECNVIVADDRFINKFGHIDDDSIACQIIDSLDILFVLYKQNLITEDQLHESTTKLRRAGYHFVRVFPDELSKHIQNSKIVNSQLVESTELKAIHGNYLRIRASDWLQLPEETRWIDYFMSELLDAIHAVWFQKADTSEKIIKSDWLLGLLNTTGWAHRIKDITNPSLIRANEIMALIRMSPQFNAAVRQDYLMWLNTSVLAETHQNNPTLYSWIESQYIRDFDNAFQELTEVKKYEMSILPEIAAALLNATAPDTLRNSMLGNDAFVKKYGFKVDSTVSIEKGAVKFNLRKFESLMRDVINKDQSFSILDKEQQKWNIQKVSDPRTELPVIMLEKESKRVFLDGFAVISNKLDLRLKDFDQRISEFNLPELGPNDWRKILSERPLKNKELNEYQADYQATPIHFKNALMGLLTNKNEVNINDLVPLSELYFQRLIGKFEENANVANYSENVSRPLIDGLLSWNKHDGFLMALMLGLHSNITDQIKIDGVSEEDLIKIYESVHSHGDCFTVTAAIEVAFKNYESLPFLEEILINLIKKLSNSDKAASVQITQISLLFTLTDTLISKRGTLKNTAPFYRRLAALSQAIYLWRIVKQANVSDTFFTWITKQIDDHFNWQSLCDLRLEPRWLPNMVEPDVQKQQLLGRVLLASANLDKGKPSKKLLTVINGRKNGLTKHLAGIKPFWAGLIDGGAEPHENQDLYLSIKNQIETNPNNFIALNNLIQVSSVIKVEVETLDIINKNLRSVNFQLELQNLDDAVTLVKGLGYVAGVSRNKELAESVRFLSRANFHSKAEKLSLYDQVEACLIAAAHEVEVEAWARYIGDWLDYLSWQELTSQELEDFMHIVNQLISIEPVLIKTCGKSFSMLECRLKLKSH